MVRAVAALVAICSVVGVQPLSNASGRSSVEKIGFGSSCDGPFESARAGDAAAAARTGSVDGLALPAGRLDPSGVYWVTDEASDDVRGWWIDLASRFESTGLWPVVFRGRLPGVNDEYTVPDVSPTATANEVLTSAWVRLLAEDRVESFNQAVDALADYAQVPNELPGDPSRVETCLRGALAETGRPSMGRIGLVPCEHPWQVPEVIGFNAAFDWISPRDMSAVLRSWEDRYGFYVTTLSRQELIGAVERPPTLEPQQVRWLAETAAFSHGWDVFEAPLSNMLRFASEPTAGFLWE